MSNTNLSMPYDRNVKHFEWKKMKENGWVYCEKNRTVTQIKPEFWYKFWITWHNFGSF